ncbi:uncharacterized protein LOC131659855 [Vicia villosa]|uniref:uncharacterized protein LOC131659855 n=1 Tax=Vicia villosa TaxID=3911 RepID=UPI00273C23EA|nr:uncharacterized protein LOC131659855 [Vicia villosa]
MVGRNDAAIVAALEAMAQVLEHQPNVGENDASRNLATFQRENPPVFKGTHDPDSALTWLNEIERIFRVMDCTPDQKVVFCREFLRKYFPEDVHGKKEIEFLVLRQGNKLVIEYAAKFRELAKFDHHYVGPTVGKGNQKVVEGKRTSGGDVPAGIVCFKYGKAGHKSMVCTIEAKRCFRCGKFGHVASECQHKEMVCLNCCEEGHIGSKCQKPKKEQARGKVFALLGTQTTSKDVLIRGMNWLEYNHVHINCYDKSVRVSTAEREDVKLLSARQLRQLMKEDVQVFALVASLSIENQAIIYELQVVREFPEVFPDEISNVPPEREVEFSIDLVHGTRPVSMAP